MKIPEYTPLFPGGAPLYPPPCGGRLERFANRPLHGGVVMNRGTALLAAVALTACGGGVSVKTDYDPSAVQAMAAYKTYSWAPAKQQQSLSEITRQRIVSAVDAALAAKGLQKVASGGDFQVAYVAAATQQTDYNTTSNYYGYGYGRWYGGGMGGVSSHTTATNWTQGTLALDIVDGKKNEMVYRAVAQAEVDQDLSPAERQTRINAAAVKMLANFPPK